LHKSGALALLEGRGQAPAPRRATPRPEPDFRSSRDGFDADLGRRLRRISEERIRERLGSSDRSFKTGDVAELSGYGKVVILEVAGDQARVQFTGMNGWTWESLAKLRRSSP
jgi:hypothetical protein